MFNDSGEQTKDDPITAIRNGGIGMTPEDAVIDRHGGGEDLGMHGHGTTVSLCYLTKLGMRYQFVRTIAAVMVRADFFETTESGLRKFFWM